MNGDLAVTGNADADKLAKPIPKPALKPVLPVTGNGEADEVLVTDPLALLTGMLLDQHIQ